MTDLKKLGADFKAEMSWINHLNITCFNLYSSRLFAEPMETLAIGCVFLAATPIGLIANVTLVLSLIKTKQALKKNACFLFMILGISDSLNALISMPLLVVLFLVHPEDTACDIEQTAYFFVSFFINISGCLVFITTVDRYIKMDPNLKDTGFRKKLRLLLKRPRLYYVVAFALFMSFALSMALVLAINLAEDTYILSIIQVVGVSLGYLIIFAGCGFYSHALFKLKRYANKSRAYLRRSSTNSLDQEYFHKVATTVLLILLALVISSLPFYIVAGMMSIIGSKGENFVSGKLPVLLAISYLLIFFNGIFNSLIFIHRNDTCKQWISEQWNRLLRACRCKLLRRRSRNESQRRFEDVFSDDQNKSNSIRIKNVQWGNEECATTEQNVATAPSDSKLGPSRSLTSDPEGGNMAAEAITVVKGGIGKHNPLLHSQQTPDAGLNIERTIGLCEKSVNEDIVISLHSSIVKEGSEVCQIDRSSNEYLGKDNHRFQFETTHDPDNNASTC